MRRPTQRRLTVALSGLNATDNPGPGLAVSRALRLHPDFAGRIVGLVYDALEPGVYARQLVDDVFLLPYPSQGLEAFEARLRHVHARVGLDVVIPNLDSELPLFVALAPVLDELGIGRFLPSAEQLELRSKAHLESLGRAAGIAVPGTMIVSSAADVRIAFQRLGAPLFVKGPFYGAERACSVDEGIAAFHRMVARWGLPALAQVEVRGDEVDVVAVGDGAGGLVGAVPMKKMLLTDKGKGWAGVAIGDERVLELTRRFMQVTRWRGPCEVELIRDRAGDYHLLEVNPRFPAWCYMSAGAGQNLPWAVLERAAGLPLSPIEPYRVGTMFMRMSLDHIVDLHDFERMATDGEIVQEAPAGPPSPEAAREAQAGSAP